MPEYAPVLIGADPPSGESVEGVIVGADPLEFLDGDTAYVETFRAPGSSSSVSFRLPVGATASPSARVTVSASRRVLDSTGALILLARPPGMEFSAGVVVFPADFASDTYETSTMDIDFGALPPEFGPQFLMSPDAIWHVANATGIGDVGTVRTTWLRFIVEGFTPLRQFHRDDGYGVTPPRAFGGASRIRTGRAYGYD